MRYSTIKDNDIANGKGIVMSLWTQGCPHHCKECFNKETWDYTKGKEFTDEDVAYIINNINKNNINRNLSVLGGEPLAPYNVLGVIELCKTFKEVYPNKKIYLWSGYAFEELDATQKLILEYIDILIDGKFEYENKDLTLLLRGSSNQRLIDVRKTINKGTIVLYEGV